MPLWARESSPGFGVEPPPDKPADEIVWCGLLKGLFKISGWSFGKSPAIECIFVTSKASSNERSGSMLGIRCASIVLPVPGLPIRSTL
ncbi:unknown [Firmicutes bacterium CAG:41]|nr:unknown [Firmicutes bacterium CAG:41]